MPSQIEARRPLELGAGARIEDRRREGDIVGEAQCSRMLSTREGDHPGEALELPGSSPSMAQILEERRLTSCTGDCGDV